jgi:hypothetical protein
VSKILNHILKGSLGWISLTQEGPVVGSYEHCDETSVSIEYREFLE